MKTKTCIFDKNGKLIRQEKVCTMKEYLEMDRLEPGQKILLGEVTGSSEIHTNTETLIVGNCTPYIMPTTNNGGIGWDYDAPFMKKFVLEIFNFA